MAKIKATHQGTCQCCGSMQKLPSGVLSTHGYTVEWGFFSGRCRGEGHLPFEQDKSLIDGLISDAGTEVGRLEAHIADLRLSTVNSVHYKVYGQTKYDRKSRYMWVKGTVEFSIKTTESGYQLAQAQFIAETPWYGTWGKEQTTEKIQLPYDRKFTSVEQVIALLNEGYINSCIQPQIDGLKTYIQWQQDRIANWSPKPLIPLAIVDKAAERQAAAEELTKLGYTQKEHGFRGTMGWYNPRGFYEGVSAIKVLAAHKS